MQILLNWSEIQVYFFSFFGFFFREKSEKMQKIAKKSEKKQKNRLEIRFALFRFKAKITQVKRSDKFVAKISEKKQKKISKIL